MAVFPYENCTLGTHLCCSKPNNTCVHSPSLPLSLCLCLRPSLILSHCAL